MSSVGDSPTSAPQIPRAKRAGGLFWVLLSVLLQTAAGVTFKAAAGASEGADLAALVWNRWYAAGILCLFLQACTWIMALRQLPLSFAYPFMSLVTVLNLAAGWSLFGEAVELHHALGVAIISAGIALLASEARA